MFFCQLLLKLTIVVDASLLGIDQEDLARLQTALAHHIARIEIHHTYFAGYYHHALLSDRVARGAQSVAIKQTARIAPIAKHESRRSIPRLHQDGIVLIKSFQIFADRVLVVERFGYQDGHCLRQ